jgi:hypothetical protein
MFLVSNDAPELVLQNGTRGAFFVGKSDIFWLADKNFRTTNNLGKFFEVR